MKTIMHNKIMLLVFLFMLCVLQGGCGIISIFSTPTRYEKKVPAEYKMSDLKGQKILVLVKQPYWLDAEVNLRVSLTESLHEQLIKNVDVSPDRLIGYDQLSRYRARKPDFSLLKAADVGKDLGADAVLFLSIAEVRLDRMPDSNVYSGYLSAQASLIHTASGTHLWPEQSREKSIKVGFEIEEKGLKAALSRLSRATAHCTVRYLYDCKVAYFKINDDRSDPAWDYWE